MQSRCEKLIPVACTFAPFKSVRNYYFHVKEFFSFLVLFSVNHLPQAKWFRPHWRATNSIYKTIKLVNRDLLSMCRRPQLAKPVHVDLTNHSQAQYERSAVGQWECEKSLWTVLMRYSISSYTISVRPYILMRLHACKHISYTRFEVAHVTSGCVCVTVVGAAHRALTI